MKQRWKRLAIFILIWGMTKGEDTHETPNDMTAENVMFRNKLEQYVDVITELKGTNLIDEDLNIEGRTGEIEIKRHHRSLLDKKFKFPKESQKLIYPTTAQTGEVRDDSFNLTQCDLFYDCSDRMKYMKNKLKDQNIRIIELTLQLAQSEREKLLLKFKITHLERTNTELEKIIGSNVISMINSCNTSLNNCLTNLNSHNSIHHSNCSEIQHELNECKINTTILNENYNECNTNLSYCKTDLTNLQTNIGTINNEYLHCKINASNSVIKINNLNDQVNTCKNELQNSFSKINHLNNDLNYCKTKLENCEGSHDNSHHHDCGDCEHQLQHCNADYDNAKDTIKNIEIKYHKCKDDLEFFRNELEYCDEDKEECFSNFGDSNPDLIKCKSDLSECHNIATTSINLIKKLKEQLENCMGSNENEVLNTCNLNLKDCEHNYRIIQESLEVCGIELEDCVVNTTNAVDFINHLQSSLHTCNVNSGCVTNLNNCIIMVNKCAEDVKDLKSQLKDCKNEVSNQQNIINGLKNQLHKVNASCRSNVNGLELERNPQGSSLYYFGHDKMVTWFAASDFCHSYGMELVSIETASENTWLKNKVQSHLKSHDNNAFYWTGLSNFYRGRDTPDHEDVWVWSATGQDMTFSYFKHGQPNQSNNKNCGTLYVNSKDGRWTNENCSNKARFICELISPCNIIIV